MICTKDFIYIYYMVLNFFIIIVVCIIFLLSFKKNNNLLDREIQLIGNPIKAFNIVKEYKPYDLYVNVKKDLRNINSYEIVENKNYEKIYNFNENKDSKDVLRDVDEIMNENLPVN